MLSDRRQAGSFLDSLQQWGDPKPEFPEPEPSEPKPEPEQEDDEGSE